MDVVVPEEFRHLYKRDPQRPIYKIPSPVLRRIAVPVVKVDRKISNLIDDMLKKMRKANGIGLAAPQVGESVRVIVIAPAGFRPTALVNPVVTRAEGEQLGEEGCLSIPALYGEVRRAHKVEVEALDRKGRPIVAELEGLPARVVQHEIDHLDGVLFVDRADPATLHWKDPERGDEIE
jgi:peptide deformylase